MNVNLLSIVNTHRHASSLQATMKSGSNNPTTAPPDGGGGKENVAEYPRIGLRVGGVDPTKRMLPTTMPPFPPWLWPPNQPLPLGVCL